MENRRPKKKSKKWYAAFNDIYRNQLAYFECKKLRHLKVKFLPLEWWRWFNSWNERDDEGNMLSNSWDWGKWIIWWIKF